MVASAPIAERIVDQLVYPRWGYEYFQQRPDGRILLGGYSRPRRRRTPTPTARRAARRSGPASRPTCARSSACDTTVTHRWVGVVGYTEDQLPFVGEVPGRPGLWVSGGYSGHGNLPGYAAGQEIADAIAGRSGPEPAFLSDASACSPG